MPVSIATARDPFRDMGDARPAAPRPARPGPRAPARTRRGPTPAAGLRVPQARLLAALLPPYPDDPPEEWPLITRAVLAVRAGYTAISGSVTRALNGIREGSSSGDAHPGLRALGHVEVVEIDVDGLIEDNYRITPTGIAAIQAWLAANPDGLPDVRDADSATNHRYREADVEAGVGDRENSGE